MTMVLKKAVYDYEGEKGYEDYDFIPSRNELRVALAFVLRDLYFKNGGKTASESIYEFLGDVDLDYIAENYEDDLRAYFQAEKDEEDND